MAHPERVGLGGVGSGLPMFVPTWALLGVGCEGEAAPPAPIRTAVEGIEPIRLHETRRLRHQPPPKSGLSEHPFRRDRFEPLEPQGAHHLALPKTWATSDPELAMSETTPPGRGRIQRAVG